MEPDLLDAGLADLAVIAGRRGWPPALVPSLAALLRTGDDRALFRINPVRHAGAHGLPPGAVVDAFLHAAHRGLVQMDWHLFCPLCGDVVKSFRSLRAVDARCWCNLCQRHFEARLDDLIEASFTVSPAVRPIRYHDPSALPVEDFFYEYLLNQGFVEGGGLRWSEWLKRRAVRDLCYLDPGETRTIALDLPPGITEGCDCLSQAGFKLEVAGEPTSEIRKLRFALVDGRADAPLPARPGPFSIEVENATGRRTAYVHLHVAEPFTTSHEPFLSGKALIHSPTFQALFGGETPDDGAGLAIQDVTILFTDLKGSTALYDRLGDLDAFRLVSGHLRALEQVVNAHGGVVLKTIGDAIMASFGEPSAAVSAALAILSGHAVREARSQDPLQVRLGLHRGPTIAVRLNARIDYFGQTVNTAARVQATAAADELCLTRDVLDHPDVAPLLAAFRTRSSQANLPGLAHPVELHRVQAA